MNELMSDPNGDVNLQCNVLPRNNIWMNNIVAKLFNSGAPVAYFVGVAHLIGTKGIVARLTNDGRLKVKRIYSLKN